MLIAEGPHSGELVVFNNPIGTLPKGYLHFVIAFSLLAEFLNMRIRPNAPSKKVKLNTYAREAADAEYLRLQ